MAIRRAGVLALVLLPTLGCYDYRTVETSARPATGTRVRVELSDAGTADLSKAIGPYVLYLEGDVRSADTDALTVGVQALRRRGEAEVAWTGEALVVPRADIRFIAERRPAKGKTILAAGGFTAIGIGLLISIARATGLVSGGPNRPGVPTT